MKILFLRQNQLICYDRINGQSVPVCYLDVADHISGVKGLCRFYKTRFQNAD